MHVTTSPMALTAAEPRQQELPILRPGNPQAASPADTLLTLPVPTYPRYPEKCGDVEPDPAFLPGDGYAYRTRVTPTMVARALRGWLVPYLGSRQAG